MRQIGDTKHSADFVELLAELKMLLRRDATDRQAADFMLFLVDGKLVSGEEALALYAQAVKEVYFEE